MNQLNQKIIILGLRKKVLSLFILLAPFLFLSNSHAFSLTVLGGLSSTNPSMSSLSGGTTISNPSGSSSPTGGVELGFSLLPKMELSTGLLLVKRHFSFTTASNSTSIDQSYTTFMIPLVLRFKPISFLSVGFGPYAMIATGKISETDTVAGVAKSPTELDFDNTSGYSYKSKEFGVMGSVRAYVPILPATDVIFDVRYLQGINDIAGSPLYSDKFSQLQFLAGLSLGY